MCVWGAESRGEALGPGVEEKHCFPQVWGEQMGEEFLFCLPPPPLISHGN